MHNTPRRINFLGMLTGILFFIFAFVTFSQPIETLISLSYLFGILALIHAGTTIFGAWRASRYGMQTSNWWILSVVLDVIIGIVFIAHFVVGVGAIGILFAIWFIFDSLGEVFLARTIRPISRGAYMVSIIFGVLSVILGFIMLFSPILAGTVLVYMIGFYMLVFGIVLIARSL
ncbi:HdeD family acid-resistance protein [Eupransor demetentiae]|uniref:DUF308 family (HdeD) n=1 Tax=Eupransor demetentiae TaxID=3109584 RepID=A0ABM9N583_9LACO|nr:Acid resistance membrane protein HdeD [Lactobacillaceae bacterium LMG 33000]